jgi:hypothetical protein
MKNDVCVTQGEARLVALPLPKRPAVRGQALAGLAARSVDASPAAPLGGIRPHEQVPTGKQLQEERDQREETYPGAYFPSFMTTMFTMTPTVKTMDSHRWICRTHLFQFTGTSSEYCAVAAVSPPPNSLISKRGDGRSPLQRGFHTDSPGDGLRVSMPNCLE